MNMTQVKDRLSLALQADTEHGVAWMNDEAARRFAHDYPALSEAIADIMAAPETPRADDS